MRNFAFDCLTALAATLLVISATSRSFAHGDLHDQIAAVTEQLSKDPKNAELFHKRGELHRAHGEYDEAFADYAAAERLDPTLDVIHLSRGRSLLEAGRDKEASDELAAYLKRDPGHFQALLLQGRALNHLGLHGKADEAYARAINAASDLSPDFYIERAANLAAGGDRPAALKVIKQGLERLGALVTLQQAALDLELLEHQYSDALMRLDSMLAATPRKETLLAQKARILVEAGRTGEARQTFRDALAAIESLPSAHRTRKTTVKLEETIRAQLEQLPAELTSPRS